jgi:thymidine kinase
MNNNKNMSYLEVIIGPMFSGKTSKILDIYKKCIFCKIPVLIINHKLDTRYSYDSLSSHDNLKAPCIFSKTLLTSEIDLLNIEVILINEGQFFDDLYLFVEKYIQQNKQIYVCGLDGDFEKKKFGQILDIIPLSDKVTKLTALCSICKNGTKAIFSKRLTDEREQTVIGTNSYIPVCRICYNI